MEHEILHDRCRGSIIGGAIGDALGYTVEFMSLGEIRRRYGHAGIRRYDYWPGHNVALFSDDTQMTLYTAEALTEGRKNGTPLPDTIREAYLAWYGGQTGREVRIAYDSALAHIDELNQRRAPGITCLTALDNICSGRPVSNDSKGCGGVMRVAPVGIYGAVHGLSDFDTGLLAGHAALITHLHPLSTLSSAALAMIVRRCILHDGPVDATALRTIIDNVLDTMPAMYPDTPQLDAFSRLLRIAMRIADAEGDEASLIENHLGGGWVAEETLAIAIFSVLRHSGDFAACMACAVNHSGDSDSTGAVAGNILGAIVGYSALPDDFKATLQLHDLIISTTDGLIA